jgi:sRNA-binding carbon storage regulator CsrA
LLKVTVLEIRNGVVKLGIEADDELPVHRSEVWDRIAAENWGADGGPDREIPEGALAETLLHADRQPGISSTTARRRVAKQNQPGKRST